MFQTRFYWLTLAGVVTIGMWQFPVAEAQQPPSELPYDEEASDQESVVTATRTNRVSKDSTIATGVISKQEISESGARTLADVLRAHPGVHIVRTFRGGGSTVQLRGLDSKHVLILVDGQPVIGRFGGAVDLDRFALEDVDRIEIVKGASSALYGSDAMGGVINIRTRPAQGPKLKAEVGGSYGMLGETNAFGRLGVNLERWNVRASAGIHSRDSFDLDPTDVQTTGGETTTISTSTRAGYRVSDDIDLIANIRYENRERQDVDVTRSGVFDRTNTSNEASIGLGPTIRFDDDSQLRVQGYYSFYRNQLSIVPENSGPTREKTFEQLAQVTTTYSRPIHENHTVTVVGEGGYERLRSGRLRGLAERMQGGLALQDEWSIVNSLQLVGGARVDYDTDFGVYPTPKVALRYDPMDALVLRAGYGMGFRAPTFKERYLEFNTPNTGVSIHGNEDLNPETSHGFDAGAEFQAEHAVFGLTGFHNQISDLILVKPVTMNVPGPPSDYEYQNVSQATTQGAEASVRVEPLSSLHLSLSYLFMRARDVSKDRALEGRAPHRGTLDVSYRPDFGLEATLRAIAVSKRPYYERQGGMETQVDADPYATIDLRLGQRVVHGLQVFGGVRNLLDAGDKSYLPIPPRTLFVGARVSLDSDRGARSLRSILQN